MSKATRPEHARQEPTTATEAVLSPQDAVSPAQHGRGFRLAGIDVVLAVLLVLGAGYLISSLEFRIGPLTSPGPGLMPLGYGVGWVSSCVLGLLLHRRSGTPDPVEERVIDEDADMSEEDPGWSGLGRPTLLVLVLFAFTFVAEKAGFLSAAGVVFILAAQVFRPGHLVKTVLLALATVAIAYFLFVEWLNIPLPTGFIGL